MGSSICTTLDIIGWLAIVSAIAVGSISMIGPIQTTEEYWVAIIAAALTGILLLALSAGLKTLYRIELAIRENRLGQLNRALDSKPQVG
jgi:hypothetical protein